MLALTRLTSLTTTEPSREALVSLFESLPGLRRLRLRCRRRPSGDRSLTWVPWTAEQLEFLDFRTAEHEYVAAILRSLTARSLQWVALRDPFDPRTPEQVPTLCELLSGPHRASHFPSLFQVHIYS